MDEQYFYDLADDVLNNLHHLLSIRSRYASPPTGEHLSSRRSWLLKSQTCKRFHALTRLHIVWTNAFKLDIVSNNYPFPLAGMAVSL